MNASWSRFRFASPIASSLSSGMSSISSASSFFANASAPMAYLPFDFGSNSVSSHFAAASNACDDGLVGRLELGEQLLVLAGRGLRPRGQVGLEEANRSLRDDDAEVGEFLRRVLDVRLHRCEDRRRCLQPTDDRLEPIFRRRERPLHEHVDTLGRLAEVVDRVAFPVSHGVEFEEFGLDRVVERFGVDGFVGR